MSKLFFSILVSKGIEIESLLTREIKSLFIFIIGILLYNLKSSFKSIEPFIDGAIINESFSFSLYLT